MISSSLFDQNWISAKPLKTQLLKWIGNKQRFAHEIISYFPVNYNVYFEPFLGSASVLATLAPKKAFASDALSPLIEIWQTLKTNPETLKAWYKERWEIANGSNKINGYLKVQMDFNKTPNGADLLFLCRACYGGVVRFRQKDGHMSTPCGIHEPIEPISFNKRVDVWHERLKNTNFENIDYKVAFSRAKKGDLIYCDPPYVHSQSILYRGQSFAFSDLIEEIIKAKNKGVYVVLSIDGTKKSGQDLCELEIPENLFEQKAFVNVGRSMLRRFQMEGQTLENENVQDRLLLTYKN